jgi:iron(III) transport system permease protein
LSSVTLAQYAEVLFRQDLTVRAFRNSMLLAGVAALSLAVIALVSAYLLDRAKSQGQGGSLALDRAALCGARASCWRLPASCCSSSRCR